MVFWVILPTNKIKCTFTCELKKQDRQMLLIIDRIINHNETRMAQIGKL